MAIGADKIIAFDPPGAIGLSAEDAVVLLRFDEGETTQRPHDAAGNLYDLVPAEWYDGLGGGGVHYRPMLPAEVVAGATGRARRFVVDHDAGVGDNFPSSGISGADKVSGSTLLTRDLTIQAILRWDLVGQESITSTGAIINRGAAYSLQLEDPDALARTGTFGVFTFGVPDGFSLYTMTRRWVSPTEVVYRYYVGDVLLGEYVSASGYIPGSTLDPIRVGHIDLGYDPFVGDIDEIAVYGRELAPEEVEATWLRITRYQPLGYQLLREMHDPGFPLSTDPASDIQLDLRYAGNALGYCAAMAENVRANSLPQRAYGSVLADWETAVRVTPQPGQDLDTRRARVLARLRQRLGSSVPGLQDALEGLIDTDPAGLEFLAFDQTIRDTFVDGIRTERWDIQPPGSVVLASGSASFQPAAGSYFLDSTHTDWLTMSTPIGGDGRECHLIAKLVFTTPPSNAEAGVYVGDWAHGNYLLLGMRNLGGSFRIETEVVTGGIAAGAVERATIGANPAAIWLHLYQTATAGTWRAAWSTTSGLTGFTESANFTAPALANLGGTYFRSITPTAGAARADFDDVTLRAPYGDRSLCAYVYRNPALGGAPDLLGADSVVAALKHAFIEGAFITSKSVLCDDENSLCDHGPMGALT